MMLILSFWAPASLRWLSKREQVDRAIASMTRLRHMPHDHVYVVMEITGIQDRLEREQKMTRGMGRSGGWSKLWASLQELVGRCDMRYRLLLVFGLGATGQWAGGGAFTAFASELFELVGVTGNTGLFTTGIYGIVKVCPTFTHRHSRLRPQADCACFPARVFILLRISRH